MSEHVSDNVKVPARYRPLLRRVQRGTWQQSELAWLLRMHRDLPTVVATVIREKLAQLGKA
jgi:RNase P/RNase MRP subunit p30